MISIITAVRNQLPMNELFIHSLQENTHSPYELIIIDNGSTDGSRELFEKHGAKIICNKQNYSYPYCQNQGIREASGDILAFFNNDIILSPDWDLHLLNVIGKNGYDVVSFATNDRCARKKETKKYDRKWKRIKYTALALFGTPSNLVLRLTFKLMYGNWDRFCKKMLEQYGYEMQQGFSGSVIAMTKQGFEKIGFWDERIQAADFDIYSRCRQRHIETGDLKPLSIISGVYIHHFGRLSSKAGRKKIIFADTQNLISFADKWGKQFDETIRKEIEQK